MKAIPEKQNGKQDAHTALHPQPPDSKPAYAFFDRRPEAAAAANTQYMADNSPQVVQLLKAAEVFAEDRREDRMQAMIEAGAGNRPGLPEPLKAGIEMLSGHSMDDVNVHYNSDQTTPLNAHAYTKGTEIHLAPGKEKHLPHEAWHVAQQKQGRVRSTLQFGHVNINDERSLENEAEVMGARANRLGASERAGAGDISPSPHARTEGRTGEYDSSGRENRSLVRNSPGSDPGIVQRYTILLGQKSMGLDYGPMKVLSNLGAHAGRLVYWDKLSAANDKFKDSVPQNEAINIVGHGFPGGIWTNGHKGAIKNFGFFSVCIHEIVPDNWNNKTIKLMTCNASVERDNSSAVAALKSSLDDEFGTDHGITVVGTEGYSYGTPKGGAAGATRVLKEKYSALYAAGPNNIPDVIRNLFADKIETSFKNRLKNKISKKTEIEAGARKWLTERDRIENGIENKFNELVTAYAHTANSPDFQIDTVIKKMQEDQTMQELMKLQDEHYDKFGFFHDVGKGYKEAK